MEIRNSATDMLSGGNRFTKRKRNMCVPLSSSCRRIGVQEAGEENVGQKGNLAFLEKPIVPAGTGLLLSRGGGQCMFWLLQHARAEAGGASLPPVTPRALSPVSSPAAASAEHLCSGYHCREENISVHVP